MLEAQLKARIASDEAVVGVMGLGYVGLPLALLFVNAGLRVIGFDVDDAYVHLLRLGESRAADVPNDKLAAALDTGRLELTADAARLGGVDACLICVPTPLSKSRQPDLSFVNHAIRTVATLGARGKLVVLESTTYPGTTDELLLAALEAGGARVDEDFLLAFSPERVDPGNRRFPLERIPKVVGGVTPASTRAAAALYARAFDVVHVVSNARIAELAKLLENTFRNVNIALVNEFAQMCDALGVDVWEVIGAAATKPFGFMPFYPGPGIGGHCIPLDPQYLVYKARLSGYEPRLVALADQINHEMPRHVAQRAMLKLNERGRAVRGASVLVIGAAYKPDISDTRESPTLPLLQELHALGARVSYHDPLVPRLHADGVGDLISVPLDARRISEADVIIIVTAHAAVDFERLQAVSWKVLDTRNVLRAAKPEVRA